MGIVPKNPHDVVGLRVPDEIQDDDAAVDLFWMHHALGLAQQASLLGEVPVGALLVLAGECIAADYNQPITLSDPSAHAEILVLRAAAKKINNYRLVESTLYVTLEPCVMCAGAMIHARVSRVVYAAHEPRTGADGSVFQVLRNPQLNHRCQVCSGVMAEDASTQLRQFFKARR